MTATLEQWYQLSGVVLGIPVAAAVIWGVVRLVQHLALVHEAIIGREATAVSDPIPSMIERFRSVDDWLTTIDQHLTEQDDRLDAVEAEFRTNGGKTLKDDVRALQRGQADASRLATDTAAALARTTTDTAATLARTTTATAFHLRDK